MCILYAAVYWFGFPNLLSEQPEPEDLCTRASGAKVFSVKNGSWRKKVNRFLCNEPLRLLVERVNTHIIPNLSFRLNLHFPISRKKRRKKIFIFLQLPVYRSSRDFSFWIAVAMGVPCTVYGTAHTTYRQGICRYSMYIESSRFQFFSVLLQHQEPHTQPYMYRDSFFRTFSIESIGRSTSFLDSRFSCLTFHKRQISQLIAVFLVVGCWAYVCIP